MPQAFIHIGTISKYDIFYLQGGTVTVQSMNRLSLTIFLLFTLFASSAFSTPLSLFQGQEPRIQCVPGTKPPTNPSYQSRMAFMWKLSEKSNQEPTGAYKWYGRDTGRCSECEELPAIIHFGAGRCAALIDVNDNHAKDYSIWGLRDLYEALNGVIKYCWLNADPKKKLDGKGYPAKFPAWAIFTKGISHLPTDKVTNLGNQTPNVLDLSEGWRSNTARSSNSTEAVDVA
ncbi:MAG: hypothetical protein Q9209_002485 [Squamulea sp. 1 TL-2023]